MSLSGGLTAGLVAGLTSRAMGGVSAWNPSRLTGLAATLLPALSLAQGKLWQNTAKTTPATADGDPVRVAVCPFTAVEFTAPSDAARPLLWDEGGGKWSLSYDGVDDTLTRAALGQTTSFILASRSRAAATAAFQMVLSSIASAIEWELRYNQTVGAGQLAFDSSSVTGVAANAVYTTMLAYRDGGPNGFFRQDGVDRGSAVMPAREGTGAVFVGSRGGSSSRLGGRVAGAVWTTNAGSSADRSSLETYLGAL